VSGILWTLCWSLQMESKRASADDYPRTGRVGCQSPMTLVRAGSSAGAAIRAIAALSDGYYCTWSTTPTLERHPCTRLGQRAGQDVCTYSQLQPNGVYHDVTYPAVCLREQFPPDLRRFYGSHWLKIDASGEADACQFAAYPWRLVCPSGMHLIHALPGMVADRQTRNGYTCKSISAPYRFQLPSFSASSRDP
jgi:hypothetical protein